MPKEKKFQNIQALEKEIRKLRLRAKQMENEFDDNFSHLQENYLPMALNSVLPKKIAYKGIPATIISLLLDNERFRNTVIKLSEEVIDRVSDGVDYLSEKLKRKKD
ncbi:MAG: hypothetical protein JST87_16165 [Bacteroidetes bacterium]|nr:hypothetical protein [Bacteroidota bacterium]MBS1935268.1 hypothetical protein [Bacteroidota bacterium]